MIPLRLRFANTLQFAIACLALLALTPGAAAAQEASLEDIEQARQLYETGSASFSAGNYEQAAASFRRVYELAHTPSVLFDIGVCEERQRHWRAAGHSYEAFLRNSKKAANRKRLEKRVAELMSRARRQDELASMANPRVTGPSSAADPGNEMLPLTDEPTLGAGETVELEKLEARADKPAQPESDKPKSRWWIWAIVGGGAAVAIGLGVGLGVGLHQSAPGPSLGEIGPAALSMPGVRF